MKTTEQKKQSGQQPRCEFSPAPEKKNIKTAPVDELFN